jgi:hypothetical protein
MPVELMLRKPELHFPTHAHGFCLPVYSVQKFGIAPGLSRIFLHRHANENDSVAPR